MWPNEADQHRNFHLLLIFTEFCAIRQQSLRAPQRASLRGDPARWGTREGDRQKSSERHLSIELHPTSSVLLPNSSTEFLSATTFSPGPRTPFRILVPMRNLGDINNCAPPLCGVVWVLAPWHACFIVTLVNKFKQWPT